MSIALDQVTKRYQSLPVVNDVSLEIGEGELLVLLGPSGGGKSTLLRAIAGLVEIDHGRVSLRDVRVPHAAIFGGEGRGLAVVQHFFNENRIRQAASSLGAAQYCIDESVAYAKVRAPFGKPLATNQAIQFPLVELQTQCEMLRALIHKTAWGMDREGAFSQSDKVSMCNYWANRLCCEAADRAMQVHGGLGYSRHKPFEHIYRHHRRYRITEGAEEIQMRRVAGYMFGYMKQRAPKGVKEG